MKNIQYDFNYDFKEVKTIFIEEELTEEEINDGLESEIYDVKVCFSSHSLDRTKHDEDREVEWEEIEWALLKAGQALLEIKNQDVFNVVTKDKTFSIIGNAHYQDGGLALIVHTVVRVKSYKKGKLKRLTFRDIDKTIDIAY